MRLGSEPYRRSTLPRSFKVFACFAVALLLPVQMVQAQQYDYDPDTNAWNIPQPSATKGEFKGDDPIGLASRQHIPTDCSITWKDDSGKTYCFASTMSSQVFQEERATLLPKAVAFWAEEQGKKPNISDGLPAAPRPR